MQFAFLSTTAPNKVSLDFIDMLMDFTGELDIMYYVRRNTAKSRFSQYSPTSHIQEFGFPTS